MGNHRAEVQIAQDPHAPHQLAFGILDDEVRLLLALKRRYGREVLMARNFEEHTAGELVVRLVFDVRHFRIDGLQRLDVVRINRIEVHLLHASPFPLYQASGPTEAEPLCLPAALIGGGTP